jgi:hypothetical protein
MRDVEIHLTRICMYRFLYCLFHCNPSWRSTRPCYYSNNVWSVIVVHGEKTDDPAGCIARSDEDFLNANPVSSLNPLFIYIWIQSIYVKLDLFCFILLYSGR